MCGIAGIIATSPDLVSTALPKMIAALGHRGPDDEGSTHGEFGRHFYGLGHKRLSIIDLSAAGHQPISHRGNGAQLVFNGEIYNYRKLRQQQLAEGCDFHSQSDSEVLLNALVKDGELCLADLNGMYAFGYLNRFAPELLLARDTAGMKPLYIYRNAQLLLFASEVRALLASGLLQPRINQSSLAGLLTFGSVQDPEALFQDIWSLPPGHFIKFSPANLASAKPKAFWRYPGPQHDFSRARAVASLSEQLSQVVQEHLVSDVPVGVALSGGVDSSILAAIAVSHSKSLRSFTVGFEGAGDAHLATDETAAASAFAMLLRLEHQNIIMTESKAEEAAMHWLAAMDQPSIDGLNTFVVAEAIKAQGITVALSGLGADELFGGYPNFKMIPRIRQFKRLTGLLPGKLKDSLGSLLTLATGPQTREKWRDLIECENSVSEVYFRRRSLMSAAQMKLLGLSLEQGLAGTPKILASELENVFKNDGADEFWAIAKLEFSLYQRHTLLRDADTYSMAHGLELRTPFLDRRLLELVLPWSGAIRGSGRSGPKGLLKEAYAGWASLRHAPPLPRGPKRGFTLPIGKWMAGPLRPWCESSLASLKGRGLLAEKGIECIWQEFLTCPNTPAYSRALVLCVVGDYLSRIGG